MRWNKNVEAFEIKQVQNLSEVSLRNFKIDVDIEKSNMQYGDFESTQLKDVNIMPASAEDAIYWFDVIVKNGITI